MTIRIKARALGYAVAVHGSTARDVDLLAVPWVEGATSPEELAKALAEVTGWEIRGDVAIRPHGRLAWMLHAPVIRWDDSWPAPYFTYFDLSVMPPKALE